MGVNWNAGVGGICFVSDVSFETALIRRRSVTQLTFYNQKISFIRLHFSVFNGSWEILLLAPVLHLQNVLSSMNTWISTFAVRFIVQSRCSFRVFYFLLVIHCCSASNRRHYLFCLFCLKIFVGWLNYAVANLPISRADGLVQATEIQISEFKQAVMKYVFHFPYLLSSQKVVIWLDVFCTRFTAMGKTNKQHCLVIVSMTFECLAFSRIQ